MLLRVSAADYALIKRLADCLPAPRSAAAVAEARHERAVRKALKKADREAAAAAFIGPPKPTVQQRLESAFPYKLDISNYDIWEDEDHARWARGRWRTSPRPEVHEWLNRNLDGRCALVTDTGYFKTEYDAFAFKMRWR